MPLSAEEMYQQLSELIRTTPDLAAMANADPNPETMRWLGRAHALVEAAHVGIDHVSFGLAVNRLPQGRALLARNEIMAIIYRALAAVELNAPPAVRGAFIPAGNALDALAAVGKVLREAAERVLIVDPYLDERVLTDFATMLPEGMPLRLLADAQGVKASLAPAYTRWIRQYGQARPIEARIAPARTLHDRAIIDDVKVWILSQSLNALAERAPATVSMAPPEIEAVKRQAYEDIWAAADPLPI